jgi:hypothetical protein
LSNEAFKPVPISVQVINLSADPTFQIRKADFITTSHEVGPGRDGPPPPATQDWVTYATRRAGNNYAKAVATDPSGNSYVTGWIDPGANKQGYVAKFDDGGNRLWITTFQAHDPDFSYSKTEGHAIAIDDSGNAYVTGSAVKTALGDTDAFALKMDPDGNIINSYGSTFGSLFNNDSGNGIAVDDQGRVVVTGALMPTSSQTVLFYGRLQADGLHEMVPFRGFTSEGYTDSTGLAIAQDPKTSANPFANAYMSGWIIPTSGDHDVFGLKVDNNTGAVVYAYTSIPNIGEDYLSGIAVNDVGEVYLSGALALQAGADSIAYAAKLNAMGTDTIYATVFDGTKTGTAISLDNTKGEIFETGSLLDGNLHAFALKLNADGGLTDDTEIFGSGEDIGYGIAFRPETTAAYVVGSTTSNDLSTDGTTLVGSRDGFAARLEAFQS